MDKRRNITCLIFASLITFFYIFGYYFSINMGYSLDGIKSFKTVAITLSVFLLSFFISSLIFITADKYDIHIGTNTKFLSLIKAHPISISFVIMLLLNIPNIIAMYPGILHSDAVSSILQTSGKVKLTTHHPIIHSLTLQYFLYFFHFVFNDWTIAVFCVTFIQICLLLYSFAHSISMLVNEASESSTLTVIFIILFYAFCPRISNYIMVIVKDVPYTAFLFLWIQYFYLLNIHPENKKYLIWLIIYTVLVVMIRTDGIIVIIFTLVFFFVKEVAYRKRYVIISLLAIVTVLLTNSLYQLFDIPSGSKRELLSVPLMQVARYVFANQDSLSSEEEQVIKDAFSCEDLDEIASNYLPSGADEIKRRFSYDVTSTEARKFYIVWLELGLRRPDIYLLSIMASNYQYFYPEKTYDYISYFLNIDYSTKVLNDSCDIAITCPEKLQIYRAMVENTREKLFSIFPFSIFNTAAYTSWILLLWSLYKIYRKDYESILYSVPMYSIMLICILSPCDGNYCRYQFPILVFLPWYIFMFRKNKDQYEELLKNNP